MAKYNDKYDQLMEYFDSHMSTVKLGDWNKRMESLREKGLLNDRGAVQTEIVDFYMGIFNERAPKKLARGGDINKARKNAQTILQKTIVSGEKETFDNYYTGQKNVIDHSFIWAKPREEMGIYVAKPKVTGKIKDDIEILKSFDAEKREFKKTIIDSAGNQKQVQFNKSAFYNRLNRHIDLAIKNKNTAALVEARDLLAKTYYKPEDKRAVDTFQAHELHEKINNFLMPMYRKKTENKNIEELKRAIILEGAPSIEVDSIDSYDEIKKMARRYNVPLRLNNKTRNEMIYEITKAMPLEKKEKLQQYATSELKELYNKSQTSLYVPSTKAYVAFEDLPEKKSLVIKKFVDEQEKGAVPKDAKLLDFVEKAQKKVNERYEYLPENMRDRVVWKNAALEFMNKANAPVVEREIEKRYMEWKYGNKEKIPSAEDLVNLSNLKSKDARLGILKKEETIINPYTGKQMKVKDTLPSKAWSNFKKTAADRARIAMLNEKSKRWANRQISESIKESTGLSDQEMEYLDQNNIFDLNL